MTKVTFTQLEQTVIDSFINELYAEPGFSDISPNDISNITKIPMNSLRGVIGSLTKKGVVTVIDKEDLGSSEDIMYLNEEFYYLHPEWSTY